MAGAPPRRRDSPPALPDELVEEILLRLPPDEPAWLLRASLMSKDWGSTISSPAFRRRLHDFHRTPPVLGFLNGWDDGKISHFVPTTASSFSLAVPDSRTWRAIDFRHGRALFISNDQGAQELLVWEPIAGTQRRVPVHSRFQFFWVTWEQVSWSVAVFCAADGCDHCDCHGGPFHLVFVFTHTDDDDEGFDIWASVFSSETGTWDKLTLMHSEFSIDFSCHSSVLVGSSLLYFMCASELILEYDLARHSMTVLHMPPYVGRVRNSTIMLTEDGGLGVGDCSNQSLKLWTREASDGTDTNWVLSRVINLVNLLPSGALLDADTRVQVVGFAEGTNNIFLNTVAGIFTIDLHSEKARKVFDRDCIRYLVPVVTFYTPVPRGEHQHPPLSGPSEETGGEVGEEKEKSMEQLQRLFDEGSNATEEGDFVNACFSHALKTRVPSHREVALECASTEYGCKAQVMNDSLDDVPKSASNETSKDDAGNSKTSGCNFEDAALPQKSESNEVLR